MLGAAGPSSDEPLLTVTVVRDEHGYGMKVSGDNPVYVQSVKEHGAAWRAGLRAGDRILKVDAVPVHRHTHQQVVHMIRANPSTVLTVQQNASRNKASITSPVPVNPEKQRQFEASKVQTVRLMLEQQQKYIRDLRNELSKVPDVRKQAQLETAEQKCAILQHEFDSILAQQTPRAPPSGFLSGLPRSLSNLTGQSLRNLRQRQHKPDTPPLLRQSSDEHHNNTVPIVPTTCLDNAPPPLPPRSTERPKRAPLSPPVNPLAKPSPSHIPQPKARYTDKCQMHQSVPVYKGDSKLRRSAHSLDSELDAPQPNSIALQMSYPLVNVPPPPLQNDTRRDVPVLHVRSQSSPEHLDHELNRSSSPAAPPGTPPPPYHRAAPATPCLDPQRAIISMEEDDSPASDNSTDSGLFSNLRSVRESKARTAVLLNWLLAERRSCSACLFLILTDAFRVARAPAAALRRWAYEIHSTFVMPHAVLQINGVDENMANEIEHILVNEHDKDEILRNVFRKARQKAKEELTEQLSEFQVKRQVGLGTLYGPDDDVLHKCATDPAQEALVVERVLCNRISSMSSSSDSVVLAACVAAALAAHCRAAAVAAAAAAAGGARASFLQRDKLYKQRLKHLAKRHPNPLVVRGHHLQLTALTSLAHCHHCELVIAGLAPQAYVCADCKLRTHLSCAKSVEESCCLDGEHHNNRISRFMERINNQDSNEKKSRKSSSNFLNMERSFRKMEDEPPPSEQAVPPPAAERRDESDESLYESADCHSDAISASDDALPLRLSKTPTMSKESLKLAITDEEVDITKMTKPEVERLSLEPAKKGHKKAISLSNPLDMVKSLGEEWFETAKRELEKKDDAKSRESLWSEEEKDAVRDSSLKDRSRKNSKKENVSQNSSRKSSINDGPKARKTSKGSSVSALNFLRRKKTPTTMKTVEVVAEAVDKILSTDEILNYTRFFLEAEKRQALLTDAQPLEPSSDDEEPPMHKPVDHRRRLSRQASRSKSKVRGKSQSLKVNTLKKSHSGTLKKNKRKGVKTPLAGRSRQASMVETTPIVLKKKTVDSSRHNSWLFGGHRGEAKREASTEDAATENDNDPPDAALKDTTDKENNCRSAPTGAARGVYRAESCRERDAPRRGKHRNASDPNRLTAHHTHDLEPGAPTAASGSSSSSSLSSRSNEGGTTFATDNQAPQSELSDEEEPLAAQWADSLPPRTLDSLPLDARLRKRQEVIHELIVSEGSHVRWLKVLGGLFLRPLEGAALLPPADLRALFPNLPSVRERHTKLYAELRAARNNASNHIVEVGPIAEAMLNTLGEAGYSACLSRFCRGQRMALEALRERRRKNKELHQFLAMKEQQPLCARLQLRDLLACVWQRLTKYQLLLESILKTMDSSELEGAQGDLLKRALAVAKQVLHTVDTSIRTAENEHRLRTIQSKLEVRAPAGPDWDELRRLELVGRTLRHEGELNLRGDAKRTTVLALGLEDSLVLLHREGDKFVLRPTALPSALPSQPAMLTPLVKWDRVLFRPNAAVRNTFFLMNINGVQMHELSAASAQEYAAWVKVIQEAPLAKLTELKPLTVSHTPTRSNDDSGINVSRNPSDASEKSDISDKSAKSDKSDGSDQMEEPRADKCDAEKASPPRQETDAEEIHTPRHALVRSGSLEAASPEGVPPLVRREHVRVQSPPAADLALTVTTQQERIRRLDAAISAAMRAKTECVAELLNLPPDQYNVVSEMAVADSRCELDEYMDPADALESTPNIHQFLLAAQTQANQILEIIQGALSADEASVVAARGRCRDCRAVPPALSSEGPASVTPHNNVSVQKELSYDMLCELDARLPEEPLDDILERCRSVAGLARRLASPALGLHAALGRLAAALPAPAHRAAARAARAQRRDRADLDAYQTIEETISRPSPAVDPTIEDEPSSGG